MNKERNRLYSGGSRLLLGLASIATCACLPSCAGGSGSSGPLAPVLEAALQQLPDVDRSVASLDYDRDGILDSIELEIGTNPAMIDTDRDGLTDHYELWGIHGLPLGKVDRSIPLTDADGDGINAALDPDDMAGQVLKGARAILDETIIPVTTQDDQVFLPNDIDGDGIPNHFELEGYYFSIEPDGLPYIIKWDGLDITKPYVKTDPTQWSSDGDPFSDWEETTRINMDQRVKSPGDHPCIPAFPKLEAVLTSYTIDMIEDVEVQTSTGRTSEKSWTNSVETVSNGTVDFKVEDGRDGEFKIGLSTKREKKLQSGFSAVETPSWSAFIETSISGYEHNGSGLTTVNSSVESFDNSGLTTEEWSTATTNQTNTAAAAKLTLNMKVINTGTLPVRNAKVLFNLKLGAVAINSFVLNLDEYGELRPGYEDPIDVKVTHDGRSVPFAPEGDLLTLSIYQLRTIQSGVPIVIEPQGFTAETLVWDVDPETGRRTFLKMGEWDPYQSSIQNVSARVVLDFREDPNFPLGTINGLPPRTIMETRVFCYRPDTNYYGSPPEVNIGDAFIWAFYTKDSEIGPIVTIRDPVTRKAHSSPLALWEFSFDKLTIEKMLADPQRYGNAFNMPLEPGNPGERVYACSAPPPEALLNPQIYWATLDPATRRIRAFSRDVRGILEMRFKPDPDADYSGELMGIGYSVEDQHQQFFYTYELPQQYVWTGFEQVIAINRVGKQTVLPVKVEGTQLGFLTGNGKRNLAITPEVEVNQSINIDGIQGTVVSDDFLVVQTAVTAGNDVHGQTYPNDVVLFEMYPRGSAGLHDAYFVNDRQTPPDLTGISFVVDYNYVRKAGYSYSATTPAWFVLDPAAAQQLTKTFAVRTNEGNYFVITPVVSESQSVGGLWYVDQFNWRWYQGL